MEDNPLTRYRPTIDELAQVCAAFRIGSLRMVQGELGGLFNVNLRVTTTSGTYVVRVHSGLTRLDHLSARGPLLTQLRAHRVPVLMPLTTSQGTAWMRLHGRFIEVTPFVPGTPCQYATPQVVVFGNMLRRFHDALREGNRIPVPYWSNYPSPEIAEEGMAKLAGQQQRGLHDGHQVRAVEHLYQQVMERWSVHARDCPTTIIHGDWHGQNVLFNAQHRVVSVLDFDGLQRAERLHDIAYFLWSVRHRPDYERVGKDFLAGYGSLSRIEGDLLPTAMARASVFFLATASFTADPVRELTQQWNTQKPYVDWLLSREGQRSVWSWIG
jgi:Ser/Thr protein kinase RdoA (MazF antagonist)